MSITTLTPAQLRKAADLQEQIEKLNQQLNIIFVGGKTPTPAKTSKPVKKGGMSAAGRAKIAAAQRARWAKVNAGKVKPAAKPAKKARRKMSAEAKAKISLAAKARWAKVKAAKKA